MPPDFWQTDHLPARLLAPLGHAYALAGALRRRMARPWRAPVPVVCIGNLSLGGTGKTQLAIALARRLVGAGRRPHILTRGYGGREAGPRRVDPAADDAATVGDEPLLLAAAAPTWIARERAAGARAAVGDGADILLMDDGYQNPSLVQDLKILVVDGRRGFGNGRVVPAGPLREPVARGLARADAVVIVGEDRAGIGAMLPPATPRLPASITPAGDAPSVAGRRIVAFAGIGDPERFFEGLAEAGADLVHRRAFADHHRYRMRELSDLMDMAERLGADTLTTAKDIVRIPPALRSRFRAFPVELHLADPDALDALIAAKVMHTDRHESDIRSAPHGFMT